MKILFSGGSSGWSEYVLQGTKNKPRKQSEIEIIDGDIELTKNIYEADNKVKESYTRIVLAFKGKENKETIKKVYQDFKNNFLVGYENDEYNISAIIHQDTENDHVHICLPKLNLKTGNHHNFYYDKTDRKRANLIRDYLNEKYNLATEQQKDKELLKEDKTLTRLEKWRKENKQPKISLKRKRAKDKATIQIKDYLTDLLNQDLINTLQDTKETLETLDLKIVNQGHDGDIYYLTIQDKDNNKLKLKGELFNANFYKSREQNTTRARENNTSLQESSRGNKSRIANLESRLQKSNDKRKSTIQARNRGPKNKTREQTNLEHNKNDVFYNTGSSNNNNDIKNINNNRQTPDGTNLQDNTNNTKSRTINENINSAIGTIQEPSKNIKQTRTTRTGGIIKNNRNKISRTINTISKTSSGIGETMSKLKKEIDIFKENISLVDFAINQGFTINEKKTSRSNFILEKDNQKILISKNKATKQNIFFNLENGQGGSIIDFYKKYINDKKLYWQILADLRKYHKNGGYKYTIKPSTMNEIELKKEILNLKKIDNNEYLKSRKIDKKTLDEFEGFIQKDNRNNTIFIQKSYEIEDEKLIIKDIGIERRNKDYKNTTGQKGLWGKKVGNNDDFYIFESPLDALAFYELNKKEGNYISVGGNMSKEQLEYINTLTKKLKPDQINLAFDNDNAGNRQSERLSNFLPIAADRLKIRRIKSQGKDWNQDLVDKKEPKKDYLQELLEKLKQDEKKELEKKQEKERIREQERTKEQIKPKEVKEKIQEQKPKKQSQRHFGPRR